MSEGPAERPVRMGGGALTPEIGRRLASYIEARRCDIVASVVRSAIASQPGAPSVSTFVEALLDRLAQELDIGDPDAVGIWIDGQIDASQAAEHARLVQGTCATIAAKYTSECGDPGGVIAYFTKRAAEMQRRLGVDYLPPPRHAFDPAKFAGRNDAVVALLAAIDSRDPATCDHSRAVGMWSSRIAKMLGLTSEEQSTAMVAGTLHDVGKMVTPTEILRKSGPLDPEEWSIMRAHARIGARFLERIPSLADLAPIVRWHHERIDGRGYPDRLLNGAIPPLARIVAVADSFHAMISKRPFRKPLSVLVALDEMRAGVGTQWDGDVVQALLAIVQPAGAVTTLRAARNGTTGT